MQEGVFKKYFKNNYDLVFTKFRTNVNIRYKEKKELKMKQQELQEILKKHQMWMEGKEGGEKADLSYANLRGANLDGAILSGANFHGAQLD